MGHAIKHLTDRVYTHMDIEWFQDETENILLCCISCCIVLYSLLHSTLLSTLF